MSPDELIDYEPEDGEWEEGVVYVDEDGNEFTVEFVYEDEDAQDEPAQEESVEKASSAAKSNGEANPFGYEAMQATTDAANEVFRGGASTARELGEAGREMKETLGEIKDMLDFKSWLK